MLGLKCSQFEPKALALHRSAHCLSLLSPTCQHKQTNKQTHIQKLISLNLSNVTIYRVLTLCNHPNIIPTSCNQFQYTRVRSHDRQVRGTNSPAIVQITLSSVKLCLSLSDVDCFHVKCNDTPLQLF
jgi:hypothetical protein